MTAVPLDVSSMSADGPLLAFSQGVVMSAFGKGADHARIGCAYRLVTLSRPEPSDASISVPERSPSFLLAMVSREAPGPPKGLARRARLSGHCQNRCAVALY